MHWEKVPKEKCSSFKDSKEVRKNIRFRFIGSCRFMPFRLDKLSSNLNDNQCEHLKELYRGDEVF